MFLDRVRTYVSYWRNWAFENDVKLELLVCPEGHESAFLHSLANAKEKVDWVTIDSKKRPCVDGVPMIFRGRVDLRVFDCKKDGV